MLPLFLMAATVQTTAAAQPIPLRLHPENPRYFLRGGNQANLASSLPAGRYRAEWLHPRTGAIEKTEKTEGGSVTLASPLYIEDIALRVKRI